jgi:ABC-type lipoprotein export system ATPase subunit
MTCIIEMSDYTLAPHGSGHGINGFYFALSRGDVCAVEAQNPDDANDFLRAVATLSRPIKGTYRYEGKRINLKSYKDMLKCKPKIGYIAPDSALISNLTIRQNILLQRYYFENDLSIDLNETLQTVCDTFGICDKLDKRPADLNSMETQMAIVIREISKSPQILLLERPEDFIGHAKFDAFVELFNEWIAKQKPVVFVTYDRRLIRRFANRKIIITNGALTAVNIMQTNGDK